MKSATGILVVLSVVVGFWTLVRWAAHLLLGAPGLERDWVWGAFEMAVALVLFGAAGSFVGRIFTKNQRHDILTRMIEAMRRIARGDFSASVELPEIDGRGPFREVATSLNQMAESLARIEAMRREFISDVSHEIQSPLTSITGFARALRSPELDEADRLHYLDIIEAESSRLSRLGDNLLRLSALESRSQTLEPEAYRLDSQIRDVVLAAEPQWRDRAIEVSASLAPVQLRADRSMLGQVWTNLLHNAIKFTPRGGTIEIDARVSGDRVHVSFRDSGLGIAGEDIERVFERFFKADASRTAAAGGSGLGLAIARKIVELHGGRIEARSEGPGRGATFVVELLLDAC